MSNVARQEAFSGGEVAPEFYARTSDPRYGRSLRTCKNLLPIRHGALMNRPGTRHVATTKAGAVPRLAPFIFSDGQTFVLELGNLYVRFYTNGGQVLNLGVPYELATPYVAADLARLKSAQSGDIIPIVHPSYQPRELSRLSNTNWTLVAVTLGPADPTQFRPQSLQLVNNAFGGDLANAWNNAVNYVAGQYAFDAAAATPQSYIALAANVNKQPSANLAWWAPAVDATHPAKAWDYAVTILYVDALGRNLESAMSFNTFPTMPVSKDRPVSIQWLAPLVGPNGTNFKITGYRVYRGRNSFFGWVGDVAAGALSFKDEGNEPNYAIQPPRGTNPFTIADGVNTANTTKWPGAVAEHDQRRVYARSDAKPNHFLGSKQNDFGNFDVNFPVQDTDAYDWAIASDQLEEIRSLLSLNRLLLFTGHAVFAAQGQQGLPIRPTGVQVGREQGEHGASYLQPLAVGTAALYVTAKGNHVRDVFFNWQVNGLDGNDLTEYARHLFDGHTIVDWCYASVPFKTVWAVRDDGLLLSCTYDRTAQVWAWARHPTFGAVKAVCSVPEGTEDAVYLAVVRNGTCRIERMTSRTLPQIADGIDPETGLTKYRDDVRFAVHLDASLQFDGRNTAATTMRVSGASYNADDIVTVQASVASFAGSDIGDQLVINPDGTPAVLAVDGTVLVAAVPPTRVTVTAFTDTTHVTGRLEAPLPAAFQNVATAVWGWARDTMTGLDHLNGLTVTALVDGVVQGPFVVAGGIIALDPPGLIVQAGLGYNSDLELLDLPSDAVKPNVKSVARTIFEVVASRGIFAGETFDKLRPAKTRKVSDDFGAPALITDQVAVDIDSSWNTGGRAVLRQSDPLPLTIGAVIREVVVGGKG